MRASPAGNKAIIFIALTMAIDMAGIGIILPVMPDLIHSLSGLSVGDSAAIGGWLVFAYAGMQFFFAPIAGGLGDRFGRRPVMLIALAGLSIDYLIMALAPTLWLLFLGRALAGIAGSTWAVANAYVADITDGNNRAKNFGIVAAAGAAGLILGPAFGGIFGAIDIRAPFYAAAALTAANFIFGYFVLPETVNADNRRAFQWHRANPLGGLVQMRARPVVLGILAALFITQLANQSLAHIWAFYVKERFAWSPLEIGVSIAAYGLTLAAAQGGLTGHAVKFFGERRAAILGLIAGVGAYLILAFGHAGWMMYLGMIVGAFGGFVTPSMQSLMTKAVPANAQGELQGAITSTLAITVVIGPVIMTQLFSVFTEPDRYFPGAPFVLCAGLLCLSALLFNIVTRKTRPTEPISSTANNTEKDGAPS